MEKINTILISKINKLPKKVGVYLFYPVRNKSPKTVADLKAGQISNGVYEKPIYIGKAVNIKNRVKNHFSQPSYRDNLFIKKIGKIGFIETNSEIEALILEANLIKKYQPKFNVAWRDDKNYFFIAVAQNKEKAPYIFITHRIHKSKFIHHKSKIYYIGPFVEGNTLKKTLKFLRKVFPYYISARHPKNKCAWCHLDLCPGPKLFENPPSPETLEGLREYKKNIKKLILIFKGKSRKVLNSLKREMKASSNSQEFENAAKIRNQILALERIMAHARVIGGSELPIISDSKTTGGIIAGWAKTEKILQKIIGFKKPIKRMECYDVSNIQGKSATGSMVVFMNDKPDKSQYKKFRIRIKQEPNDIAMLKEILIRRFNHPEWDLPEVVLIDGGKAQLNIAIKCKNQISKSKMKIKNLKFIKIISIAKGRQELFIESRKSPIPLKKLPQEIYNLIKYLDDEAHRFAIAYHKKLRKRAQGLDGVL